MATAPDLGASAAPVLDEAALAARPMPAVYRPGGDASAAGLAAWLEGHRGEVEDRLLEHGALLFRGFRVTTAPAFERVALAVEPGLQDRYLGTSPREGLTRHVFTASELPGFYPIPQHCEMSFLADPPRRLFFCCLRPNDGPGGETPLVDFRAVYEALDPAVRDRFVARGIRIVRNYDGPEGGGRFDLWKLKRWDEMFGTTDRDAVEATCRAEGFDPEWLPGGRLRLVSTQPAVRTHPVTGRPAWFSHVQVFHLDTGPSEYRRIWRDRREVRYLGLWALARVLVAAKRLRHAPDEQAMHCTYADGGEIPAADLEHLRDVIWRHLVRIPWELGDVVAIDNRAVAHGRMPYRGPRIIAVAWA